MFLLNGIFKSYKEEKSEIKNSGIKMFCMIIGFILIMIPLGSILFILSNNAKVKSEFVYEKLLLTNLFLMVFPIIYILLAQKILFKHKFESLGFSKNKLFKNYFLGAIIGSLMFSICILIGVIIGVQSISINHNKISYFYIFLFLVGFLFQGMYEEVILRGFIFSELSQKFGIIIGIIFNSLIFALLHGGNPNMKFIAYINLFLFGVFQSLMYYKFQNLWIVGAIHSFWNFCQGNIFGVSVSGITFSNSKIFQTNFLYNEKLTGGNFGTEGGLICTFVLIIFSLLVFYVIKNKQNVEI